MIDLEQLLKETLAAQADLASQTIHEPSQPSQPQKRQVLENFLGLGMTQVAVDCTLPGVRVPDRFVGDSQLLLNFSYKFATRDLQLTDEAIEQTLSFGGQLFGVRVPLRAIVGARSLVTGQPAEFQIFTGEDYQQGPPPEPVPT